MNFVQITSKLKCVLFHSIYFADFHRCFVRFGMCISWLVATRTLTWIFSATWNIRCTCSRTGTNHWSTCTSCIVLSPSTSPIVLSTFTSLPRCPSSSSLRTPFGTNCRTSPSTTNHPRSITTTGIFTCFLSEFSILYAIKDDSSESIQLKETKLISDAFRALIAFSY